MMKIFYQLIGFLWNQYPFPDEYLILIFNSLNQNLKFIDNWFLIQIFLKKFYLKNIELK